MAASMTVKESSLDLTIRATTEILERFAATTSTGTTAASTTDALQLAHDAASLVKAQSTKLSLLMINEPFTPSAVEKVLKALVSPLTALASAVGFCRSEIYSKAVAEELQWQTRQVYLPLNNLIKMIPREHASSRSLPAREEILAATGVVWEACDATIGLREIGIAGILVTKVKQYQELIVDALDELRQWSQEESEEDSGDGEDDNASRSDTEEDDFACEKHIPKTDPDGIRPRVEKSLKNLKLTTLMYQAVCKRRFKKLDRPSSSESHTVEEIISRVDAAMEHLKAIPNLVDDLATMYYSLDPEEIDKASEACFTTCIAATKLLSKSWDGESDEFTQWVSLHIRC